MERILARAVRAKNQAARALKKQTDADRKTRLNNARREHTMYLNIVAQGRKKVRAEEKEDQFRGPLKPQRAVGKELEIYGAFDQMRITPPQVPEEYRIKYWNIVPEDRVVLLKGPDRHKIGKVKSIDRKNNTLIVEGFNMAPMIVPDAFKTLDPEQPSVMETEMPLHYDDVRLVYPLPDPQTGDVRDSIIANIDMTHVYHDRREKRTRWKRLVGGTNTVLEWPKVVPKEQFDQPGDTRIMDVETGTYVPTLLKPPFPGSVIDELRNKYSKYRTRHDPEYVVKVEAEETERLVKENWRIRTPLQELNRLQRQEKKAKGQPVLSEDVLTQIGKVMAENKPQLLEQLQLPQEPILQQQPTV